MWELLIIKKIDKKERVQSIQSPIGAENSPWVEEESTLRILFARPERALFYNQDQINIIDLVLGIRIIHQ